MRGPPPPPTFPPPTLKARREDGDPRWWWTLSAIWGSVKSAHEHARFFFQSLVFAFTGIHCGVLRRRWRNFSSPTIFTSGANSARSPRRFGGVSWWLLVIFKATADSWPKVVVKVSIPCWSLTLNSYQLIVMGAGICLLSGKGLQAGDKESLGWDDTLCPSAHSTRRGGTGRRWSHQCTGTCANYSNIMDLCDCLPKNASRGDFWQCLWCSGPPSPPTSI